MRELKRRERRAPSLRLAPFCFADSLFFKSSLMGTQKPTRIPPKNVGLLQLIRAKQEWHWKPTATELKAGFRGWHQRGFLPHFDAPGVTQFVTFQLSDAFPVRRSQKLEAILQEPDDSGKRRKIEAWLDRGHGERLLRGADTAGLVENILCEKDRKDYQLQSWVVMPNHVHLVVDVWDIPLARLINDWKGKTARAANQLLKRQGPFWQEDYYDTLVRDEAHLKRAIRYTENNPVKACLVRAPREWLWSSARHRDEYERLRASE